MPMNLADYTTNPLQAAYHLAVGSGETARDVDRVMCYQVPPIAEQFAHLATNFERIAELLKQVIDNEKP